MIDWVAPQQAVCRRFNAPYVPARPETKAGASRDLGSGIYPVNGLRHPETTTTCGWYLWVGEELSRADDFFEPLHVQHLEDLCPAVMPYLGLPPGWRFLIADGYQDVWFDASLLDV